MKDETKNQWIWLIGTLFATYAWTFAFLLSGYALGLYITLILPMASFFIFRKTTSLFDTTDEERERMRQDALKKIKKDFVKSLKTMQVMGYVSDLTEMSYMKDQWTDSERATFERAILFLIDNVEKRMAQKPLRQMQPEEIRYLVEQKRRKQATDTFLMLKEEKKKKEQEISMLEELLKASEDKNPEADGVVTSVEEAVIEIRKIDEELKNLEDDDEIEYDEINDEEDDEEDELESLEDEVKALDEQIEEIEEDEDCEDEDEPLIKQGIIYDVREDDSSQTGFAPVEKKSLREVLGAAMTKLKEVEDNESKS